MIIAAVDVEN